MQRAKEILSFYLASYWCNMKSFFTYRLQAAIWLIESTVQLVMNLVVVAVIYGISSGIPGWSYYQLLFLTYFASLTFSIVAVVATPWRLPQDLRTGAFDSYMTKPYGLLTIMSAKYSSTTSLITGVFGSLVFLAYAAAHLSLPATFFVLAIPAYLVGMVAYFMFLQVLGVLSYVLIRSGSFINRAIGTMGTLSRYPLPVFGSSVQLLLTLLVPLGLAIYYPVEVLFGNVTPLSYVSFMALGAALSVAFYLLFNRLMRSYESGGG
ncbi:ABC-2 family transporter protein [uncultured archaeon]|nr:ABC-2 family transporter protein [uncultured archaeon]